MPAQKRHRLDSPDPSVDSVGSLSSEEELMNDDLENESDELGEDMDDLAEEEEEEIDEDEEMDTGEGADSQDLLDSEEEEEEDEDEERTMKAPKRKKASTYEEYDSEEDEEETLEVVSNRPLTKRQRAKLNNDTTEEYLELPMESMKKKHLTAEEQSLRRSEVARRRKNQSIQRAEKDKQDTINRLLKKQASKSRRVIKEDATDDKETAVSRRERLIKDKNLVRYVNKAEGSLLAIPESIKVEDIFGVRTQTSSQNLVKAKCEADGCDNPKKYTAKKSGKAVCSLEHYKLVEAT
ncbi:hypothetical protein VTP01DRAFT_3701 [Rhizomucor pusillus]|uniref:uncharacterized protein n=1 Tax=Rhizomucor pusillus TaxID=4840 RepID=UPI0037434976